MADNSGKSNLLGSLIGTGGQLLGGILGQRAQQGVSREQLAEQKRQFDIRQGNRQQEVGRRNAMFGAAAPGLMRNLGYTPGQVPGVLGQMQKQQPPQIQGVASRMAQPGQPSGGGSGVLGKVAGAGGLAAGIPGVLPAIGHALGIGGTAAGGAAAGGAGMGATLGALASNPITIAGAGALGVGLLAKHLIGRGRRAADELTHPGGMQNAFEGTLKDIDAAGLPEAQAWGMKKQAYEELKQLGMEHAKKGGKDALVVHQMFDTISPLFKERNPMDMTNAV